MKLATGGGGGGEFLQQPEGDAIQAVCCDVVDEGVKETNFGPKHKVSLRFQSAQKITAQDFADQGIEPREEAIGEPFLYTNWFTASLHEKSNLARELKGWGVELPKDEGVEFDLDSVIGRNALLRVEALPPQPGKDTPFMAVQAISPLPKFDPNTGEPLEPIQVSPNYVRVQDRDKGDFQFGANAPDPDVVPEGAGT